LLAKEQETSDALKISRMFDEYEKDGQIYTKITLKVNPKKQLKDLSLYEKIPKCLAKHIDDIEMDEEQRQIIKILNPDPLVMWQFDEMASEKEFSYEVKGVLSEDCKKQLAAIGIADELGIDIGGTSLFKILLPLLIIPLVGGLLLYVEKFAPRGKKGLPKPKIPGKANVPAKEEKKKGGPETKPQAPKPPKRSFEEKLDSEIDQVTKELEESLRK
jgi:hypothetical protein